MVAERVVGPQPRRVAMLSLHTSPVALPGSGDAGGMNVYVDSVARTLARLGVSVEVFTQATDPAQPASTEVVPGYRVHQLSIGAAGGLDKADLPSQLGSFCEALLRHGEFRSPQRFDVLHSHYWLSGQIGWAAARHLAVPWVHSMHTLARVKNAKRALGEPAESADRILGEEQIVSASDLLVANTDAEAAQLRTSYQAAPDRIAVVHPGVDLHRFSPARESKALLRRRLGLRPDAATLLFVGRLQPLKAPDVAVRALAELVARGSPGAGPIQLVVCGGPSGANGIQPSALASLAGDLGIGDLVQIRPPVEQTALAELYRAADLTLVPSYSESFGLVALESQACGTPVVATDVGGLATSVADGVGGLLVSGHDPRSWARTLERLVGSPALRANLASGARGHAERFSWEAAAAELQQHYRRAGVLARDEQRAAVS